MKKYNVQIIMILISLLSMVGCDRLNEAKVAYYASPDRYTYEEDSSDITYRSLYEDSPIPLDEGSSLFFYVRGAAFFEKDKPKEQREYSESYIITQPSMSRKYETGYIKIPEIKVEKEDFDTFVLAVKGLRHRTEKERASRETFLMLLKEKTWSWAVDPATKNIEAVIGADAASSLKVFKNPGDVESYITSKPIAFVVHYDLFTDEIAIDVLASYSGDRYLDIKKINIATDVDRFSFKDFTKTDIKAGKHSIEQATVAHYETIAESMSKGSLPRSLDSKDMHIDFIGLDDNESYSIDSKEQMFLLSNLSAISILHHKMVNGEVTPEIVSYVNSGVWRYDPIFYEIFNY